MNKLLHIALVALLAVPNVGLAATFTADEAVTTTEDVQDDLYAAGNNVSIQHPVAEDAFVAGENVLVDQGIGQDLYAAGNQVTINGPIGDDLFTAGNAVTIDTTTDDLFAAGSTVQLSNDTVVNGDAYIGGETVTLGGTINGTVRVAGNTIVIQDNTTINGDLRSYGPEAPQVGDNVTVTGTTTHEVREAELPTAQATALLWVRAVLTLFVGAFVLLYLLPVTTKRVTGAVVAKPFVNLGLGALFLILFAPLALLLMVSTIAFPLAIIVILLAIVALMLGWMYSALVIGERVYMWITKKEASTLSWQHALLGAVIVNILALVPVIGWLVTAVVSLAATGALVASKWQEAREND